MNLFGRRRRRDLMLLPLTAMIDIFALIIIFLVKGTFFGATDIPIPEGMKLPNSVSKESVETAPRVQISNTHVSVSFLPDTVPVQLFDPARRNDGRMNEFRAKLATFTQSLPGHAKKTGVLLSVIADRELPYKTLFDTVRVFREAGFETLLFIAAGPEETS